MALRQLLDRKRVIQFFGVAALLSPLVDNYLSAFVLPRGSRDWNLQVFLNMIASRTFMEQLLFLTSFFIGGLMLRGKPSSWNLVLVLLGGQIFHQSSGLFQKTEVSSIAVLILLFNIALFLMIAKLLHERQVPSTLESTPPPTRDQGQDPAQVRDPVQGRDWDPEQPLTSTRLQTLIPARPPKPNLNVASSRIRPQTPFSFQNQPQSQKQIQIQDQIPTQTWNQVQIQKQNQNQPQIHNQKQNQNQPQIQDQNKVQTQNQPQIRVQKKVDVYFEGFGNWAQLIDISKEGIHVRCLAPPPEGIDTREIEIAINSDLTIRIRLSKRIGPDLYFKYQKLTSSETKLLNQWLLRQTA